MFARIASPQRFFGSRKLSLALSHFKRLTSGSNGLNDQVTAVLGSQWGDEGKGKLVDILANKYDVCARFNGGANAGHTLVVDGKKFAMHLLPCGVLNDHCINVIGNGVVIHVPTLMSELQNLANEGFNIDGRIKISDRAHILFDFHQEADHILETMREKEKIGTTRRGIGPCYATKMLRNGIRFGELRDFATFKEKYLRLFSFISKGFNLNEKNYNANEELSRFEKYSQFLLPMIEDTVLYINQSYNNNKKILIEGANAALLDIDFGTYPMVTASNTTHGGISTGLGLAAPLIDSRIGVTKAYTTRVGHGPFPTEQNNEIGDHMVNVGHEYGTTTGRKRRCGWIDVPLLHYSHLINHYSSLNITKLDVLDDLDEIQIASKYKLNDKVLPYGMMPSTLDELSQITVEYETLPGWKQDISECQTFNDLPINAQNYLNRLEELLQIPITWIGVGPDRNQMVGKGFEWK